MSRDFFLLLHLSSLFLSSSSSLRSLWKDFLCRSGVWSESATCTYSEESIWTGDECKARAKGEEIWLRTGRHVCGVFIPRLTALWRHSTRELVKNFCAVYEEYVFQNISIYSSYHTTKGSAVFLLSLDYCKRNRRSHSLSPHSPMLAENSRPTNCARCEKSFCEENENLRRISVLSWRHSTESKTEKILKTFFSSHILYTRHWELCSVNLYRRIESTTNGEIPHSRGSGSVWNWEAFHLLLSLVVCSTLIARYNTEIPRDKFLVCNQIALIF